MDDDDDDYDDDNTIIYYDDDTRRRTACDIAAAHRRNLFCRFYKSPYRNNLISTNTVMSLYLLASYLHIIIIAYVTIQSLKVIGIPISIISINIL